MDSGSYKVRGGARGKAQFPGPALCSSKSIKPAGLRFTLLDPGSSTPFFFCIGLRESPGHPLVPASMHRLRPSRCGSSDWYLEFSNHLDLFHCCWIRGILVTVNHLGWILFPADWPWRSVEEMTWDLEVRLFLSLVCSFILCIHLCCCLGRILLQVHSSEPDLIGIYCW